MEHMQRCVKATYSLKEQLSNDDRLTALVSFERGDMYHYRLIFNDPVNIVDLDGKSVKITGMSIDHPGDAIGNDEEILSIIASELLCDNKVVFCDALLHKNGTNGKYYNSYESLIKMIERIIDANFDKSNIIVDPDEWYRR
jgi:hypothetical protein